MKISLIYIIKKLQDAIHYPKKKKKIYKNILPLNVFFIKPNHNFHFLIFLIILDPHKRLFDRTLKHSSFNINTYTYIYQHI